MNTFLFLVSFITSATNPQISNEDMLKLACGLDGQIRIANLEPNPNRKITVGYHGDQYTFYTDSLQRLCTVSRDIVIVR